MNTDEVEEEVNDLPSKRSKEIDDLLEPKAIPDERIVRHAERNDSYREAPSLTNDEEIIQPPLDPPEEEAPSLAQEEISRLEKSMEELKAESRAVASENMPNLSQVPYVSQLDIEPLRTEESEDIESVSIIKATEGAKEEEEQVEQERVASQSEPLPEFKTEAEPKVVTKQSDSSVVYHTVSGGPETIHEAKAEHHAPVEGGSAPVEVPHTASASASGYSIPNPNYVAPQPVRPSASSLGFVFFLFIVLVLVLPIAYLYFFLPDVFAKMYEAILIVKDQLLK